MSELTTVSFRVNEDERQMIVELKRATGGNQSEVLRRALWIYHAIHFDWVDTFWERVKKMSDTYQGEAKNE